MSNVTKIIAVFLFLLALPLCASVPEKKLEMKAEAYISDESLKELAIEKGIIPENVDDQAELDKKNTVILWILQPRQAKTNIIDFLKQKYKKVGVSVRRRWINPVQNLVSLFLFTWFPASAGMTTFTFSSFVSIRVYSWLSPFQYFFFSL